MAETPTTNVLDLPIVAPHVQTRYERRKTADWVADLATAGPPSKDRKRLLIDTEYPCAPLVWCIGTAFRCLWHALCRAWSRVKKFRPNFEWNPRKWWRDSDKIMLTVLGLAVVASITTGVLVAMGRDRALNKREVVGGNVVLEDLRASFSGRPLQFATNNSYECSSGGEVGIGTYHVPLKISSPTRKFWGCEIVYAPVLRKYLVYEPRLDEKDCVRNTASAIDLTIWIASSDDNRRSVVSGSSLSRCVTELMRVMPSVMQLVRMPGSGLPVDDQVLYDSATGVCHANATF